MTEVARSQRLQTCIDGDRSWSHWRGEQDGACSTPTFVATDLSPSQAEVRAKERRQRARGIYFIESNENGIARGGDESKQGDCEWHGTRSSGRPAWRIKGGSQATPLAPCEKFINVACNKLCSWQCSLVGDGGPPLHKCSDASHS